MKRTALALVALVSLFLAGTVVPGATPAQANTINGTAENSVALFQWIEYGGSKWQTSFNNVYQHSAGGVTACMNIAPATWPTNGDNVNDNSGSLVVNGDPATTNVWSHYNVYLFDWINCNPDGDYRIEPGYFEESMNDLSRWHYSGSPNHNMYHSVTSIGLIAAP